MDRRDFSKLLTLGSGVMGMFGGPDSARAGTSDDTGEPRSGEACGDNPTPEPEGRAQSAEPVNVQDFQRLAKAALPAPTYDYITTGSTDEVTLRDNTAAFQRFKILPPLLTGVAKADLSTTILGERISMPILLAPVAGQSLFHRDGGLASARGAARAGTIFGMSSSVGNSVEEIAAASEGPKWFQLYVPKDRGVARRLVERADRAGFKAIVVTVDLGERKDADRKNRFALPRPTLLKHLRDVGFDVHAGMSDAELAAFNEQAWDPALSWEIFDWLRSITKLPVLIKGVLRPDDARKAVSLGLDGIVVSNHGGRRLDGVPASIDQLEPIAQEVQGKTAVLLDSGVRRGTDVLKALALGANAVLIGRPYAWALAADGEAGVRKVLELLREELELAMVSTGCPDVKSVHRSLLEKISPN